MRRRTGRSGSRKFSVPNLNGLTRSQAIAAIQAAGFNYSESQQETNTSGLNLFISGQSVSSGTVIPLGSTIPFVYYNYVEPAPVITYGPCEAYGSGTNVGSGTQCSGEFTQSYIDYSYSTRKKIYSNDVWDGVSYSTEGCSPTTSRSVTGSSQVNGQCGYVTPATITYGSCQAYGSPIANLGSGNQCSGSFYQTYTDYRYNTRRQIFVNGSWDGSSYDTSGCGTTDSRSITGSSQIDGLCGYSAPPPAEVYGPCEAYSFTSPTCNGEDSYVGNFTGYRKTSNYGNTTTSGCPSSVFNGFGECIARNVTSCGGTSSGTSCSCSSLQGNPCGYNNTGTYDCSGTCVGASSPPETCVCNYSDLGSYHYSPQCCPGGSQRTGSLSGQTVNSCCPNVSKTQKFECKSYDVTNSASVNYFQCYSVGQCAANSNPDGSRTVCYV
jgi:hypothetical protein